MKELRGRIFDIKGQAIRQINIINQTHNYGAASDINGDFNLPVYLKDTLFFSSISHENFKVIITDSIWNLDFLELEMKDEINLLEDINLYSGFTMLDTNKTFGEINLGLPFKSKPRTDVNFTPGEKQLSTAKNTGPIGSIINIFNRKHIKSAKEAIALEKEISYTETMRSRFDDRFFELIDIPKDRIYVFLEIYALEAKQRQLLRKEKVFELTAFLKEKAILFLALEENIEVDSTESK